MAAPRPRSRSRDEQLARTDQITRSQFGIAAAARASAEPQLKELKEKSDRINALITEADLKIVEVKQKVGPLIYIGRAFSMDIDQVVKYLILVFVLVFDPLAICLVIATSQALQSRQKSGPVQSSAPESQTATGPQEVVQMRFVEQVPPSKPDKTGT